MILNDTVEIIFYFKGTQKDGLEFMKIVKILFWILWRIWFYIVMMVFIIAFLPIILISISSDKLYKQFFVLARWWGKFILFFMGFWVEVTKEQELDPNASYMLIANHTSMIDIMLMLSVVKNPFVFVGKKELARFPIFGLIYRRTSILVDRGDSESRKAVYYSAQKRIKDGLSICIFPEGKVPDDESIVLDHFKGGAFSLAIEHQLPIVPMSFGDNKRRFSYTFFSGKPGKLRVKIHKFIETKDLKALDRKEINQKSFDTIYNQLIAFDQEYENKKKHH